MKTILIAAVSAVALSAAGAAQAQDIHGKAGASYARSNIEIDGLGDGDADIWTVQGGLVAPLGERFGLQLDGEIIQADFEGGDATIFSPTAHLLFDLGAGKIGGFIGSTHSDDGDFIGGGVEGRMAISDSWKVNGSLGYGQADAGGDVDVWAARGEVRYYLTDNTRFDGFVNYTKNEFDGGDADGWTYGVNVEHRFGALPVSAFGRYERSELDAVEANTFRVGLSWAFGGSTLKDSDERGPSMPTIRDMFGGTTGTIVVPVPSEPVPLPV